MARPVPQQLERLVDENDFETLLSLVTLDDIAEAWCRHTAKGEADRGMEREADDPDWWAIAFFMEEALFANRELHRAALLKLLEHATTQWLIGCIGAGPLENFVSDDDDDLRWIERIAPTNQRLRLALRHMWVARAVSDKTLARLDAAAGELLPRPVPRDQLPAEVREVLDECDDAGEALRAVAGDDWWNVVFDNPTPEQEAALRRYLEADTNLRELGDRGSRGD